MFQDQCRVESVIGRHHEPVMGEATQVMHDRSAQASDPMDRLGMDGDDPLFSSHVALQLSLLANSDRREGVGKERSESGSLRHDPASCKQLGRNAASVGLGPTIRRPRTRGKHSVTSWALKPPAKVRP